MATTATTLPDDPGTLKAMLLAERACADRLEQIIRELQRHHFGGRAESLPEDQLLLGLEEVEQTAAANEAATEGRPSARCVPRPGVGTAVPCRHICCGSTLSEAPE